MSNHKQLEALFNTLLDGVVAQDPSGKIVQFNPAALKILGLTEDQLLGRTSHHPDWRAIRADGSPCPGEEHPAMLALRTGMIQENKTLGIHLPNGALRWLSVNAVPIFGDAPSTPEMVLVTFRDTTLERETKAALAAASRLALLGEMASGVAHEINNPLTIIFGKLHSLKKSLTLKNFEPEKATEILQVIEKTTERISKIVAGLLSFARDESTDLKTSTPVSRIIRETLELYENIGHPGDITLRVLESAETLVECHPGQIAQILLNFLRNATDAVKSSTLKHIEIRVIEKDLTVLIEVENNGPEIPPEIAKKIMEPFFTTKPPGRGTGLGLSISQGLAEKNGGTIRFESRKDKTCFTLELPKSKSP